MIDRSAEPADDTRGVVSCAPPAALACAAVVRGAVVDVTLFIECRKREDHHASMAASSVSPPIHPWPSGRRRPRGGLVDAFRGPDRGR